nr:DoxX family protein [Simplicispira hankyongi]
MFFSTTTMTDKYASTVSLAGRILLALMFIPAGFGKLTNIGGTAGYIASGGLPFPSLLAVLAGALELFGGLALVIGFKVRWVGLAMALFTLVASMVFHPFWSVPEAQQMVTKLLFMKNISVVGGMLLISALGAGALSVDERNRQR